MAKVVGIDASAMKRITCRHCASVVEYAAGEVRTLWQGRDMSGAPDGATGLNCPQCGHDIIVDRW